MTTPPTAKSGAVTSPLPEYSIVRKSSPSAYVSGDGDTRANTGSVSSTKRSNVKRCTVTS
jgi:hypothetical protein